MSRVLQLEMSDSLFRALSQQAAAKSVQPEAMAIRVLEDHLHPVSRDACEDGKSAFRGMFGAASLGHATGLDNEAIDAELAKEYGRGLDN